MAREKITAYVPPDLAETMKRLAAVEGISLSDIVEEAISKHLSAARGEAEHAALMAKLENLQRRLGVIERSQETLFELTAHAARFSMSVAPEIADGERQHFNARGAERFANVIEAISKRLGGGKSVWKDNFIVPAPGNTSVGAPSAEAG